MEQKRLNKGFIKRHPLKKMSPYIICEALIEDDIYEKITFDIVMNTLPPERIEQITADRARIEAAGSGEELATLFRKNIDITLMPDLISKALEYEDEVFPHLFKRYCTSTQTELIEGAARFFGLSQNNYTGLLLEAYDSIRDPYAQAQACVVIGLRGSEDAIPKMFSEYERFLHSDDDSYSRGPLLALHNFYERFYAK